MLRLTPLVLLLAPWASDLGAQTFTSNSYLPLEHRAMPFLEYLVARGVMADPSPMVRPWTVGAVVRKLNAADTNNLTTAERSTLRELRAALDPARGEAVLAVEAQAAVRAATHARREPLRESGPRKVYPLGELHVALQFGPAVLATYPVADPRALKWDPDFTGRRDEATASRWESAYAAYRTRYLDVAFGTVSRNWGPPELPSAIVSPVPYSYDHLFVRAGPERIHLEALVTHLDDFPGPGVPIRRYWVVHRVAVRPLAWIDVAPWQATLLSGPARGLEIWYLNPLKYANAAGDEENVGGNALIGMDVETRLGNGRRVGVSLMIDDVQTVGLSTDDEPPSYALTLTTTGPLAGGIGSLAYTQVANLTYRTPDPSEAVMRRGIGLGRNFSDYDQATARTSWLFAPGVLLGAEATLLRQGEGDFRLPFPDTSQYDVTPRLFAGVVERTLRAAGNAHLRFGPHVALEADAGLHRVSNADHVVGRRRTRFVGSISLKYRFGGSWLLSQDSANNR